MQISFLIHSANPQLITAGNTSMFSHMLSVRPSVPTFQNLAKQNKFQVKTMFTTGDIVGPAEWIIHDTCLALDFFSICVRNRNSLYRR